MATGDKKPVAMASELVVHTTNKSNPHEVIAEQVGAIGRKPDLTSADDLYTLENGMYVYEGTVPNGKNYPSALVGTFQRCMITVSFVKTQGSNGYNSMLLHTSYGQYFYNSKRWNSWVGWKQFATTNYAVSKAGDTMTGGLSIVNESSIRRGVFNTDQYNNVMIHNSDSNGTSRTTIQLRPETDILSDILRIAIYKDSVQDGYYSILHTGLKPSGSYTGNGSSTSRTINIGGSGKFLLVMNVYNLFMVWTHGAVCFNTFNKDTVYYTPAQINFSNGVLTIATDSNNVNYNGATYDYQVL